jgi:Bromodomain
LSSASPKKNPTKRKKDATLEKIALKSWPNIPLKDITRVSQAVLTKVVAEDIEGHFGTPVLESYPELANDYLEIVDEPMDFRTIEEERIPQYTKIKDLQTDLFMVFDNCSQFNGADTDMGQYAVYVLR